MKSHIQRGEMVKVYCVLVWESGEMKTEVWGVFNDKEKAFAYAEKLRKTDWLIENDVEVTISGHVVDEGQ